MTPCRHFMMPCLPPRFFFFSPRAADAFRLFLPPRQLRHDAAAAMMPPPLCAFSQPPAMPRAALFTLMRAHAIYAILRHFHYLIRCSCRRHAIHYYMHFAAICRH